MAAIGGVVAVLATSRWERGTPWWLGVADAVAGVALAVAALVTVRVAAPSTALLAASSWSWALTSAGLPSGGLTRALLVHVVLTSAVRGRADGRRRMLLALLLAYVSAVPAVDELGWPWLLVSVAVVAVPRRARAWVPTGVVLALLVERAWIARAGLLGVHEAELASLVYAVLVLVLALAVCALVRRARPRRGAVIGHVLDLAGGGEESRVAAALVDALDDPALVLDLTDDGLVVDSVALERDPTLAHAVAEVGRLVVANRRLRRDLDDALHDLQASSARLLVAEDQQAVAHRARLERGPRRRLARIDALMAGLDVDDAATASDVATIRARTARADAAIVGLGGSSGGAPQTIDELTAVVTDTAATLFERSTVDVNATSAGPLCVTTCWYVCAESLANAAKHAQASTVSVVLVEDGADLAVEVRDDGAGGADAQGWGLAGLRNRVVALGGWFDVESEAGVGTTVRASVPR